MTLIVTNMLEQTASCPFRVGGRLMTNISLLSIESLTRFIDGLKAALSTFLQKNVIRGLLGAVYLLCDDFFGTPSHVQLPPFLVSEFCQKITDFDQHTRC